MTICPFGIQFNVNFIVFFLPETKVLLIRKIYLDSSALQKDTIIRAIACIWYWLKTCFNNNFLMFLFFRTLQCQLTVVGSASRQLLWNVDPYITAYRYTFIPKLCMNARSWQSVSLEFNSMLTLLYLFLPETIVLLITKIYLGSSALQNDTINSSIAFIWDWLRLVLKIIIWCSFFFSNTTMSTDCGWLCV